MTESQLMQLLDVVVIGVNAVSVPLMLRTGRRWTAASQATVATLFALVLWGRSSHRFDSFVVAVCGVLMIALVVLTVMSLRELRRELGKPR